jgi:hypothetical protein
MLMKILVSNMGKPIPIFKHPTTHDEAEQWLENFYRNALNNSVSMKTLSLQPRMFASYADPDQYRITVY